jgi:nitrate reductase gamma subunit
MKKSVLCVCFLFYVFLLLPVSAHAYLDMGSISMGLQFLVAGLAGCAIFLRLFWSRITDFLARKKADPETESETPMSDNDSEL